jgi:hypothetical protein
MLDNIAKYIAKWYLYDNRNPFGWRQALDISEILDIDIENTNAVLKLAQKAKYIRSKKINRRLFWQIKKQMIRDTPDFEAYITEQQLPRPKLGRKPIFVETCKQIFDTIKEGNSTYEAILKKLDNKLSLSGLRYYTRTLVKNDIATKYYARGKNQKRGRKPVSFFIDDDKTREVIDDIV